MLRIAVVEKEAVAKDIIFEIAKVLDKHTWTFEHFTKISSFAKADAGMFFDMVFFNEIFDTNRVHASFITNDPKRIVIFCMNKVSERMLDPCKTSRILYMERRHVLDEVLRLSDNFHSLLKSHEEYLLSYNNVHIALRMHEILYIEKSEKNVIYHTLRGEFSERRTMQEAQNIFHAFDFVRIHASYLINSSFILKISNNMMELTNHEELPIAKARKKEVIDWFHEYVQR